VSICLTLATRKNSSGLQHLWKSAIDLAEKPEEVTLSLYIDNDDHETIGVAENLKKEKPNQVGFKVGKRLGRLCYCAEAATESMDNDYYFYLGDDVVFKTPGWDSRVNQMFEQYEDRLVFCGTSDNANIQNDFSTHFVLSKRVKEIVGFFNPPYYSQNYIDTYWNEIFHNIDRHRDTGIRLQHNHDGDNKVKLDRLRLDYNFSIWYNTVDQRRRDAIKLLDAIEPGTDHSDFNYKRIYFI
jgi:hypothetical protein